MGGPEKPLNILAVATYYRPYLSGLTVHLQRLAEAVVAQGHRVTVLAARFPASAALRETLGGVHVVRAPVWFSVGKGVVAPALFTQFSPLARDADAVWLFLPQAEAGALAWLAKKRLGKKLVVSYLCDVSLGNRVSDRVVERLLAASHRMALKKADAIVASSQPYAASSPLLKGFLDKVVVLPPPVPRLSWNPENVATLRQRLGLAAGQPVVGWVGRVSREKGLHVLAAAMPQVWAVFPQARVVCAGPRREVAGEGRYLAEVTRMVEGFGERWMFTGVLPDQELAAFYALCTVLAFPSINRTEAFGMVQGEAMSCGTPVVASDLPGVREPVQLTGMGLLVPPGDPQALAEALTAVLADPGRFRAGRPGALEELAPGAVAARLLRIFTQVLHRPLGDFTPVALQ